jgi:cytoskeletal protein RodZ
LDDIGNLLRESRESQGVSIEEASEDLDIKKIVLENIEDGNIGSFKDIFLLKDYLTKYAKYLGLDDKKVIDNFNDYLFEYTSKIPLDEIEKAIEDKKKDENRNPEERIVSPYTSPTKKDSKVKIVIIVAFIILATLVAVFMVSKFSVNSRTANIVSYNG